MSGTIFEFGEFTLDCDRFELRRAGRILKLEKKPMELLILLAANNGNLVTRTEIAERLWEREVFVDTEHGINTAVRKVRQALRDDPEQPSFVQTVTGKGYRFVPGVKMAQRPGHAEVVNGNGAGEPFIAKETPDSTNRNGPDPAALRSLQPARKRSAWLIAASVCAALLITGTAVYSSFRMRPSGLRYTQLTNFTDSAVAPALSPDGRMIAFIRGSRAFLTADQIYVKVLPDGEATRVTDDWRPKYDVVFTPTAPRSPTVCSWLPFSQPT